jgi:hypothetical protein
MNSVSIYCSYLSELGVIFLLDFDKTSKSDPIILPTVLLGLHFKVKGTQIYKSVFCYRQNINIMAIYIHIYIYIYIYITGLCNIYSSSLIYILTKLLKISETSHLLLVVQKHTLQINLFKYYV